MTAEQFLADLEVKAKAIFSADQGECTLVEAQAILEDFSMAANPAAVLRLVGMVRWLSPVLHKFCEELCTPYKIGNGTCTECPLLRDGKCIVSAEAMLSTAYAETEDRHD